MARSTSTLVNKARQRDTKTEKGMVASSTTLNSNLDMFFMAGATRSWSKSEKQDIFRKALVEDPSLAMKILFWARDIRGGSGERDFFRDCLELLDREYPNYLEKNLHLIPKFGRWDDLFHISEKFSLPIVSKGLKDKDPLLSKWLPRKKQYDNFASKVRKYNKLSPKEYRKTISNISHTVEQLMCSKNFDRIEYQKVPSMAMNKYRSSFYKNDPDRFSEYIEDVKSGKSKMNADAIYPHNIYRSLVKSGRADRGTFDVKLDEAIEAQWNSLPNYMEGCKHRILPLIDVSPSMTWNGGLPLEVSISLGIYISERNESIFKDAFITFSERPTMEFLKGSFSERVKQLRYAKWGSTTNLEKSFDIILEKAIENNIDSKYMPTMLLIISDMQFDKSTIWNETAIDMIKRKYNESGYEMPQIVFWNVRSKIDCVPVEDNEKGVGLISGFSPSILKDILKGDIKKSPTPLETMMNVINSGRYDEINI